MPRLRKQIEWLHRGEPVAGGKEAFQIAHLRCRVARHIDDRARTEREELIQEGFIATFPRWIDHDRGVGRGKSQAGKNLRGVAGEDDSS